ncbi:MAG: hypothetical protein ACLPUO_04120 [Streptosporangiaceae bacterium]
MAAKIAGIPKPRGCI